MKRDYETLDLSLDDRGVCYLTLNLPEKRNALSATMIDELTEFATTFKAGAGTRVVVMRGAGKVFCAGGDLKWMQAQIAADRATRIVEATKLAQMLRALNELPAPLIGQVHGGCFGGGVGMASVCDTVIAHSDTKFGLTETRLGIIPATIGPYVIARMGEGRARRVFMNAEIFGSKKAVELGLVAQIAGDDDMDAAVQAAVFPYLNVAPLAVAEAKALARELGPTIDEAVITRTIERLADIWEGEEATHGIDAFFAKQKPRWQ